MKVSYIVAILAIILLVGCAQEKAAVTPAETTPTTVVETPSVTTTTVVEKPAETPKSEIKILANGGFDPAEPLTVKKGTTVKWVNTAPASRIITINGKSSGTLKSGDTYEYTFTDAGTYKIYDYMAKKWGTVVVTE